MYDITPTHHRLGAIIRAERLRQGLTQPQLAELAGVSIPTLLTIETVQRTANLGTFIPIATALGLRLDLVREDE